MKKSQSSLKDYMYSRAKVGAPKGNLGGEPNGKYPIGEIKSKQLEVGAGEPKRPDSENTPLMKTYLEAEAENNRKAFKDKYERGLVQREINQLRQREAAMGGSKNVTKKIQRRAKFKKALDKTIMFLGSN